MAGSDRPDFEPGTTVSSEAARTVVRKEIVKTNTLPDQEVEVVEFQADPGTILTQLSFGFVVGVPAGSGVHEVRLGTDLFGVGSALRGIFAGSNDINILQNEFRDPSQAARLYPSTPDARITNVQGVVGDDTNPVRARYENFTGDPLSKNREYRFSAIQVGVE